jgi:hypothetical protein
LVFSVFTLALYGIRIRAKSPTAEVKKGERPATFIAKARAVEAANYFSVSKTAISLWSEFVASLLGHVRHIEANSDLFWGRPVNTESPLPVRETHSVFRRRAQIVRPSESTVEIQPKLQPALLSLRRELFRAITAQAENLLSATRITPASGPHRTRYSGIDNAFRVTSGRISRSTQVKGRE